MYIYVYVCREIQELFFELEECEYEIDRIEMLEIEAVEAKRRTEVPAHIHTYIHTYIHDVDIYSQFVHLIHTNSPQLLIISIRQVCMCVYVCRWVRSIAASLRGCSGRFAESARTGASTAFARTSS
jgi:hypothetical protein